MLPEEGTFGHVSVAPGDGLALRDLNGGFVHDRVIRQHHAVAVRPAGAPVTSQLNIVSKGLFK